MLYSLIIPILCWGTCSAFVVQPKSQFTPLTSTTLHAFSDHDNEEYRNALANNMRRTDIQQFLTQRSLQSFMLLLTEVRDPHTSDWIERFLGANNLLAYHGTGAFNMTRFQCWDTYFLEMMEQPKERLVIEIPSRQGGGGMGARLLGGSRNNPYLKKEQKVIEHTIDVDPQSLVPRILSVREQIGKEFAKDVDFVRFANDDIMKSYETKLKTNKAPDPLFDRTAMQILNHHMSMETFAPSALRKGNYDLLQLLSLHEAVHRQLREYKDQGAQKSVSFAWLRDFFVTHVADYFDGVVHYGSADNFIEEILRTSPTVKQTDDGKMELVDPKAIASDIIDTRSEVLLDWKDILEQTPQFHIGLRKKILSEQVKSVEKETEDDEYIGAFE